MLRVFHQPNHNVSQQPKPPPVEMQNEARLANNLFLTSSLLQIQLRIHYLMFHLSSQLVPKSPLVDPLAHQVYRHKNQLFIIPEEHCRSAAAPLIQCSITRKFPDTCNPDSHFGDCPRITPDLLL